MPTGLVTFSDLATAAYCPRKLYYARRGDRTVPEDVESVRALAFEYEALADAAPLDLAERPIDVPPAEFRRNLARARDRFAEHWPGLVDPAERRVLVTGKDCRGYVTKLLAGEPPVPTFVSPGEPPPNGVWEPQTVRAVAAAKAVAWREGTRVERTLVEYPAHGVVREVPMTARRRARYQRALRTVRSIDGPPPRVENRAKCEECEFREECGVKTRSLRSLLGVG